MWGPGSIIMFSKACLFPQGIMSRLWSQECHGVPIRPCYQELSSSHRQGLECNSGVVHSHRSPCHDAELLGMHTIMRVWHFCCLKMIPRLLLPVGFPPTQSCRLMPGVNPRLNQAVANYWNLTSWLSLVLNPPVLIQITVGLMWMKSRWVFERV